MILSITPLKAAQWLYINMIDNVVLEYFKSLIKCAKSFIVPSKTLKINTEERYHNIQPAAY